jgi:hypothetical protein
MENGVSEIVNHFRVMADRFQVTADRNSDHSRFPYLESDRRTTKWKPITLAILFGGRKQPPSRLLQEEIDAESELMQALAEVEERERPDDGAVEIDSDEEFHI